MQSFAMRLFQAYVDSRACATGDSAIERVIMRSTMQSVPPLGIIMLDTEFHRPLGDVGNPASWPFPVVIERVPRAYAKDVVSGAFNSPSAFLSIAQLLRAKGCVSFISTCGFLARIARISWSDVDIAGCVSVLFQYEALKRTLPLGKRVAILTIDANSIDATIRANCNIPDDAIIVSPPREGNFCRAILDESEPLDVIRAERELVEVAVATQRAHPEIGLWLFECANMPPYRAAVERATGMRVYDALQMGIELHRSSFDKLRTSGIV
jgi:hypothetical protein